jgi:hypothetical protein
MKNKGNMYKSDTTKDITGRNPFKYGKPISTCEAFFGREFEIRRIQNAIHNLRCISVVGERRVGKTSLCKLAALPELVKAYELDENTVFCSVDFQSFEDSKPEDFWKCVLARLSKKLSTDASEKIDQFLKAANFASHLIPDLFGEIDGLYKIIFIYDEFEAILENENFTQSFYGCLRNVTQNYSVSFITSTRQELKDHGIYQDNITSEFYNVFENLILPPFRDVECRELISTYLAKSDIKFSDADISRLIELSGGYPGFFQMACSFLYTAYSNEEEQPWKCVEERLPTQLNGHFAKYTTKTLLPNKIRVL